MDKFDSNDFSNIKNNEVDILEKKPEIFSKSKELLKPAPATENGSKDCTVTMSWFLGDSSDPIRSMESILLAEILMGHDGSPLGG